MFRLLFKLRATRIAVPNLADKFHGRKEHHMRLTGSGSNWFEKLFWIVLVDLVDFKNLSDLILFGWLMLAVSPYHNMRSLFRLGSRWRSTGASAQWLRQRRQHLNEAFKCGKRKTWTIIDILAVKQRG